MLVEERGAAVDRLGDGNVVFLGEGGERLGRERIVDAAAGDDQRLLGMAKELRRLAERVGVGPRPRHAMHLRLEELDRIVIGFGLRVLRQRDEGRAAIAGVEHHGDRLGKRRDDLLRPADPVPIAGHRLEGVVDRRGGIAEMLDLLQHRVGNAVGEGVAAEEEDRQPVRERHRRGGDHVGRARADRGGRDHDLPALLGLGVGDRRQRHRSARSGRARSGERPGPAPAPRRDR